MPDARQGQKQAHGGDDTGGVVQTPVKKPSLDKFVSMPDMNVRDLFWKVMDEYAARKGKGVDPRPYADLRTALVRIALSVLQNPQSAYHGLSPGSTALYTLIMVLEGEWEDMFIEILEKTGNQDRKLRRPMVRAMQRLLEQPVYRDRILLYLENMIKNILQIGPAMLYVVELGDVELVRVLKKWIVVVAQTDIEANQIYAISALSMLKDDPEVKPLFLRLLTHWDVQTRRIIALLLLKQADDDVVREAARQLPFETDEDVRALLQKIVGKKPKPEVRAPGG